MADMKAFILLFVIASSRGLKWKAIDEFKDMFQEYKQSALQTISTIENVLNNSRIDSTDFLRRIYSYNSFFDIVSANDSCSKRLHEENNMILSFRIQGFQLETPLQIRIIDIRQRINNINTAIDTYQTLADGKFSTCQFLNNSCMDETNHWLESRIYSLSCDLQPNCKSHSIKKRSSSCDLGEYKCRSYEKCIAAHYYCDGHCNCNNCDDEPRQCVRYCGGFRCTENFRCISTSERCDGKDDCGDGTDEENCSPPTTPSYYHGNCSIETGDFLCDQKKCIKVEQVCDGFNDCEDGLDEGDLCKDRQCSPECSKTGGICLSGPKGPQCLFECPPGTFETSVGCSLRPEAPPANLAQAIDDTPRLLSRHSARFSYLKTKTMMEISRSMLEFVRCKRQEFILLSKVIRFSSTFPKYKSPSSISVDKSPTASTPVSSPTEEGLYRNIEETTPASTMEDY